MLTYLLVHDNFKLIQSIVEIFWELSYRSSQTDYIILLTVLYTLTFFGEKKEYTNL